MRLILALCLAAILTTPVAAAGPLDSLPPMRLDPLTVDTDEGGILLVWQPVPDARYYTVARQVGDAEAELLAKTFAPAYYDATAPETKEGVQVTYVITAYLSDGTTQVQTAQSKRGQCLYMKEQDVSVSPFDCVPSVW